MDLQEALFIFDFGADDDGDGDTLRAVERKLLVLSKVNWRVVGKRVQGTQREVARLYAMGYTTETIARELGISVYTVREHITTANYKLLVHLVAGDACEQNAVVFGAQAVRCGLV